MRIKHTSLRWNLLPALLVALSMATPVAADTGRLDDGHGEDGHTHSGEEELYALDAASSAPGATFFNESSGCGEANGAMTPATTTNSSSNRSIPSNHQVRGPWADFFGRDYSDVGGSMVSWTVPLSGGRTVLVHERAYPAFQQVSQSLAARAAEGKSYHVRMAASWVWRRIGGSYRMSTHAFGTTIDINWDTNPYTTDNRLITDMPDWFVDAWRDAGFCWGGDWLYTKDTMHFSWMGPAATSGYGNLPAPYPPNTNRAAFDDVAYSGWSGFSGKDGDYVIADGNGDGAPDLVRLRDHGSDGIQLSYARSSMNFRRCGVSSYTAYGAAGADMYIVADYDGDSRPDLWAIDTGGSRVSIEVFTYRSGYRSSIPLTTGASPRAGAAYLAGDYNRDGDTDLYVVTPGTSTRVEVWNGSNALGTRLVDGTASLDTTGDWQFSVMDQDVDGRDDVAAIDAKGAVRIKALRAAAGFTGSPKSSATGASASGGDVFAMGDLDGDGRSDLWQIDNAGRVTVRRGGNSTLSVDYWYQRPDWSCGGLSPADPFDINGDSFHEMALGVPGEDIDEVVDAGAVNLIFGSKDGPGVDDDELFYHDLALIEGVSEKGDRFGSAIASGDFDHDGRADLAVAAPRDDVGNIKNGGLVNVLMGSSAGISSLGGQLWHRDQPNIDGTVDKGDRFGSELATGDFNDDGFGDLVIGVPGDDVAGRKRAGSVNVIYGTKQGLKASGDQLWHQDSPGIAGTPGAGDRFGASLAAGDFDDDGYDDLAVGAPGDTVGAAGGAGQIHVLYGSKNGLTSSGNMRLHQDTPGVLEVAGEQDRFGAELAAGDFDGDGYDDIAVGVPKENDDSARNAGKVQVFFGGSGGVTVGGNELWSQASAGVGSGTSKGDRFGDALAAGDFDDDGFADLAVGVPGEDFPGAKNTGAVNLLYGRSGGLHARGGNILWQGDNGLVGNPEAGDRFGASLRSVDVDGNSRWDLIIGMPGEDLPAVNAGAVILVLGSKSGLKRNTSSVWHQDTPGVEGTVEAGDGFGRT